MHVTFNASRLAPNDHAHFCVRFQATNTVDDIDSGSLHALRPLNITSFVEPRLKLNNGRYVFAVFRGVGQRVNDFAVPCRSIQCLFDRDHVGVVGRRLYELDDWVIRLVGVAKESIARRDHLKHVVFEIEIGRGMLWPRLVLEMLKFR